MTSSLTARLERMRDKEARTYHENDFVSSQQECYLDGANEFIPLIVALAKALSKLPIGQCHNVSHYDCDGDSICHKHCPACEAMGVLAALEAKLGGG